MQNRTTQNLVTTSAVVLATCGIGLIFGSGEVSKSLFGDSSNSMPVSLWGGAMLGFGAMNWVARHSILGGIYGRAVVVGNQVHFFVGTMILLRLTLTTDRPWPFVATFCVYLLHAVLFSYLMFGASGIDKNSS